MSDQKLLEDIEATITILAHSLKEQPGNESEIFKLIIQMPLITSTYLPRHLSTLVLHDHENEKSDEYFLFGEIAKWAVEQLNYNLDNVHSNQDNEEYQGKIAKVCQSVEILNTLGGSDFAKEKFCHVLSRKSDILLQNNMEYVPEISKNITQVEGNFTVLVENTKQLALDAIFILFLSEGLNMSCDEQINFISDPILEKLSVELLTLVDSLKESIFKQLSPSTMRSSIGSSSHINLFTALTSTIGEDTCFNSQELISLANIANLFLDLESSLQKSEYTLLLKAQLKNDKARKSALKQRSQLPDLLRSSQESSWVRSSQIYGNWNWQEILKDIGPMVVKSIARVFDECQNDVMNYSRNTYHVNNSCSLVTVASVSSSVLSGAGIPRKVIACFGKVLELMKTLLPFAVLGSQYKPLSGLCTCYIDESSQAIKSMKSFLTMLLNDVPSKASINTLYYVLATCEDICSMLTFCASKMEPDPRVPFQGILQLYKDLNKTVKNTIIQSLVAQLSVYIMHDADSHHWSDPKEFDEGENCSFSIIMWNLFLKQLWSDLGSCVSEVQRNEIFKEVFTGSLDILQSRYARCEPSYNRAKQVELDICAVLETCKTYLFHLSFHVTSTFPNDIPVSLINVATSSSKLQSSCNLLLSVLYLLTRPLEMIEGIVTTTETERNDNSGNWLCIMCPKIFPEGWDGHVSGMPANAVLKCITEMDVHPSQSLLHCLYTIVMCDYFVLDKLYSEESDLKCTQEYSISDVKADIMSVFTSCTSSFDDAFFHIAYRSVQKDSNKLMLSLLADNNETCIKFSWQVVFHSSLSKILCQSMRMVGTYISSVTWSSFASSITSSLPTVVNNQIISISGSNIDDRKSCELACVLMLIQSIEHAIYCLPEWLATFFINCNEVKKNENDIVHVLITSTCDVLKSPELWEKCHGIEFRREGIECMARIAERLLQVFKNCNHSVDNALENAAFQQIHNLHKKVNDHFIKRPLFDCSQQQLFEKCQSMLKNLDIKDKQAIESLKKIRSVICENRKLLCGDADIVEGLTEESDNGNFNPLAEWEKLSRYGFGTRVHDVGHLDRMCTKIVSRLDEKTIKSLLSHRWEMKDGAFLNDQQTKIVQRIKNQINSSE